MVDVSASVAASGSVTGSAALIEAVSAPVTPAGSVTGSPALIEAVSTSVTPVGSVTGSPALIEAVSSTVGGQALVSAGAIRRRNVAGTVAGTQTLTATTEVDVLVRATVSASASVTPSPAVIYAVDAGIGGYGQSYGDLYGQGRTLTISGDVAVYRPAGASLTGTASTSASPTRWRNRTAPLVATGGVSQPSTLVITRKDAAGELTGRALLFPDHIILHLATVFATVTGDASLSATGHPLLRPAMYSPTLATPAGELTPRFSIDLYDGDAQPYDAAAVDEARLTVTHEPTGSTLVDGEPMAVESGPKAARAEYSFAEGEAFELERVGGHTATVDVSTGSERQAVPDGGGLAIRAGDTPGYQQLSLDGAGIERGLAARETDRTATMAAFDSVDVTTADVDEAVFGTATTSGDFGVEKNFDVAGGSSLHGDVDIGSALTVTNGTTHRGDVTLATVDLLGDDATLTLDTQPTITAKTSGVDPLHITDATGTSVLEAHEGGGVDIGDFLDVSGAATLRGDVDIGSALTVTNGTTHQGDVTLDAVDLLGDNADLSLNSQPTITAKTSGVDPLHITDATGTSVLEAHEGGGVDIGDFLDVGGASSLRGDVDIGSALTVTKGTTHHGNVTLDAVDLLGDDADFSLDTQPTLSGTTSGVDPLHITDAAGTSVLEAREGGDVGVPNGTLSEQGNRVATRTWTDSNYTNYTDSDARGAIESGTISNFTVRQGDGGLNANVADDGESFYMAPYDPTDGWVWGRSITFLPTDNEWDIEGVPRAGGETIATQPWVDTDFMGNWDTNGGRELRVHGQRALVGYSGGALDIGVGGDFTEVNVLSSPLKEAGNRVATRTWTNNNADVPNADHADEADNAAAADDATMWDGYERYIQSSAPSTSNPYIRFEPK